MAFLNLAPNPWFLAAGVVLDLLLGDPNYPAHPVRLIGWTLTRTENALRNAGFDGYGGGIALFLILSCGVGGRDLTRGRCNAGGARVAIQRVSDL